MRNPKCQVNLFSHINFAKKKKKSMIWLLISCPFAPNQTEKRREKEKKNKERLKLGKRNRDTKVKHKKLVVFAFSFNEYNDISYCIL
jgi:hypothetical protein